MATYAIKGRGGTMVVNIYDSRLHKMSADWAAKKAREVEAVAKARVIQKKAVRTGRLLAGIHAARRKQVGGITTVKVHSSARYSKWVHEGTYGPIHARNGPAMWVPKFKYGTLRVWRTEVNGQAANPFLNFAMRKVLRGTTTPFH